MKLGIPRWEKLNELLGAYTISPYNAQVRHELVENFIECGLTDLALKIPSSGRGQWALLNEMLASFIHDSFSESVRFRLASIFEFTGNKDLSQQLWNPEQFQNVLRNVQVTDDEVDSMLMSRLHPMIDHWNGRAAVDMIQALMASEKFSVALWLVDQCAHLLSSSNHAYLIAKNLRSLGYVQDALECLIQALHKLQVTDPRGVPEKRANLPLESQGLIRETIDLMEKLSDKRLILWKNRFKYSEGRT